MGIFLAVLSFAVCDATGAIVAGMGALAGVSTTGVSTGCALYFVCINRQNARNSSIESTRSVYYNGAGFLTMNNKINNKSLFQTFDKQPSH